MSFVFTMPIAHAPSSSCTLLCFFPYLIILLLLLFSCMCWSFSFPNIYMTTASRNPGPHEFMNFTCRSDHIIYMVVLVSQVEVDPQELISDPPCGNNLAWINVMLWWFGIRNKATLSLAHNFESQYTCSNSYSFSLLESKAQNKINCPSSNIWYKQTRRSKEVTVRCSHQYYLFLLSTH